MDDGVKVAIRRFHLASLGKFGCLLGAIAAILPSLLCGLVGLGLVNALLAWLEGWQELNISVLGNEIASLDLIQFLNLEALLHQLRILGTASGAVLFLAVVATALVSGVAVALVIVVLGLVYNLVASASGGMVVELSTVRDEPPSDQHT